MRLALLLPYVLILAMTGCTSIVPSARLPFPLSNKEFAETSKVVTIPLPVIAASPNEGVCVGGLTAFLIHNKYDEVSTLVAPQANYNTNFGTTASLYGAFFPSPERNWEINLSKSTKVNEDYELRIRDKTFFNQNLELNAFIFSFTDGSSRFFGFQSDSLRENETNYADTETGFTVSAGYPITKDIQVVVGERLKKVSISQGAVAKIPYLRDNFTATTVPGIEGFTAHAQKIALVYNTLNFPSLPTSGNFIKLSAEASSKVLGSSAEYRHYEAELKSYYPLDDARFITVARLVYNQTLGNDVPFLERSILGGENTLRGFGRNRFIDSCYFLGNLEERIRLFRWEVFDVRADWELAPFIDLGAVMSSVDKLHSKNFVFNPGLGFRAVVRPNIVGRVDVGWGKEGPAVFVGLGYPF